jgi:hypothetical protein
VTHHGTPFGYAIFRRCQQQILVKRPLDETLSIVYINNCVSIVRLPFSLHVFRHLGTAYAHVFGGVHTYTSTCAHLAVADSPTLTLPSCFPSLLSPCLSGSPSGPGSLSGYSVPALQTQYTLGILSLAFRSFMIPYVAFLKLVPILKS